MMIRSSHAAEAVAASVATKATYTGSGVAVFGGLTSHEWIAIGGLLVAIGGFLLNAWVKLEARQRAKLEHAARMRRLERGMHTDTGLDQLGEDD